MQPAILSVIIASIVLLYFLKDRYGGKITVDYHIGNAMAHCIDNPSIPESEWPVAIGLTGLRIVNRTKQARTVKAVNLRYKKGDKAFYTDSHVLPIGAIKTTGKGIILKNLVGGSSVCDMEWVNLRVELAKNSLLQPGGALSGCALFILSCKKRELQSLSDFMLEITDFSERIHRTKLIFSKPLPILYNDDLVFSNDPYSE